MVIVDSPHTPSYHPIQFTIPTPGLRHLCSPPSVLFQEPIPSKSLLMLFTQKCLKHQRSNLDSSPRPWDDPMQLDNIYLLCTSMWTMALQSEIQAQWNTTERSQLSSINYLSEDNNHGVIPHERGLCSLEQEERRGGCCCLLIMKHQIGQMNPSDILVNTHEPPLWTWPRHTLQNTISRVVDD